MKSTLYSLTALLSLAVACASEQPVGYAPYSGDPPYPDTRPKLVLPAGEVGFVTNSYSDTIDVLRMDLLSPLAKYPVGRIPFDIDGPHHLAIDKAAGAVYVALSYPQVFATGGPHAAHGSSTRAGYVQKLALSDFRELGTPVRVDENPGDIIMSDDGKRIVVSHFDVARAISKGLPPEERKATLVTLDAAKHFDNPSASVPRLRVCRAPHGVVLSPGRGQFAYVACYADDAIAKVDLDTKAITLKPLGAAVNEADAPQFGPYALALSPSAATIAIGSTEGKDIRFMSTDTLAAIGAPVPMPGAAYFPAWSKDESRIFVPTQVPDMLVVVDVATGVANAQRTFRKDECEKPHEARVSKDGTKLFVVCEGDHVGLGAVVTLDTATLQIVARQTTGVYPDRLVVLEGP